MYICTPQPEEAPPRGLPTMLNLDLRVAHRMRDCTGKLKLGKHQQRGSKRPNDLPLSKLFVIVLCDSVVTLRGVTETKIYTD